ncbi:MAG: 4-hydroxy-tetrahydrodipicolinate synthase [Lachnospiraceae bacterium]
MNFGTLLTAMITPFDENLEVDYEQAERLARHLVQTGSEGIVIAGTTGESPALTRQEKQLLLAAVKAAVGNQTQIVMGAGTNTTRTTIEEIEAAGEGGADAVMLVVPYYNKPSQEGLYEHFKQAAESSRLPVILYNIPGRTGSNLLPETVKRLAHIEQIAGIKESSGNLGQITEIRMQTPDDFLIYSGDDAMTLPILSVGGTGIISVAGHIAGADIAAMIQLWKQGQNSQAAQLHTKLYPLFKSLFLAPNPGPVKYALGRYGFNVNRLRLPMKAVTSQEQIWIDQILDRYDSEK